DALGRTACHHAGRAVFHQGTVGRQEDSLGERPAVLGNSGELDYHVRSSSQRCLASPQLRPNLRATRIGTLSCTASSPSRATNSACSRELTEHSSASCICKSGTTPSRQTARIHNFVWRAAEPWIRAFIAL